MQDQKHKKIFILALLFLALSLLLNILFGASSLSFQQLIHLLWGKTNTRDHILAQTLLFGIRLPRIALVMTCGASLAAAGVISQGLFRNPLASPSILGTNAGGVLGAILVFYTSSHWHSWQTLPIGAFLGSVTASFIILALTSSKLGQNTSNLIICGFALASLYSALSSMVLSILLSDIEKSSHIMRWMMGGFSGKPWHHLIIGIPTSVIGLAIAKSLCQKLDVLTLGEDLAHSLSVNVRNLKIVGVTVIALLVSTSVSIAGMLPFVGLMVPHISRKMIGSTHQKLLFLSVLNGMSLVLLADLIARTMIAPKEIEVGAITSIVGVIFFFVILMRRKHESI